MGDYRRKLKKIFMDDVTTALKHPALKGKEPRAVLIAISHMDGHTHVILPNWRMSKSMLESINREVMKQIDRYTSLEAAQREVNQIIKDSLDSLSDSTKKKKGEDDGK